MRRLQVGGDGGLWPVGTFAEGRGLPLAGGPFGGTAVVVLPKGTSDADKTAWLAHEQKVLKRRSMFANIAIACEDGEPSLPQVVTKLKGAGRSRLLLVPAVFCADAATMGSCSSSSVRPWRSRRRVAAGTRALLELATTPPSGR
ncbi:MAG: hypothetical protein U1F60_00095 [Planctomycetota bacterium]